MDTLYSRTLVNLTGLPVLIHFGDDDEVKRLEPSGGFVARPPAKLEPVVTRIGTVPVVCYTPACLADDARELLERYRDHAVVLSFSDVAYLMASARHPAWKPLNVAILSVDPRTRHGLSLLGAVENARRLELHGFV